jgi:hypothetical protein
VFELVQRRWRFSTFMVKWKKCLKFGGWMKKRFPILRPVVRNKIRWSSTYAMVKRYLKISGSLTALRIRHNNGIYSTRFDIVFDLVVIRCECIHAGFILFSPSNLIQFSSRQSVEYIFESCNIQHSSRFFYRVFQ